MQVCNSLSTGERHRVWMTLSGDFKKQGSRLMQQQCWCWGFDVRRQEAGVRANLLLDWGFERTPPPEDQSGATTYQKQEADGNIVTLWGFGMCFGDEYASVFLPRFSFGPLLGGSYAPVRVHSPKELGTYHAARTLEECQAALNYFERALLWISEYENRVLNELGAAHRLNAFADWGHQSSSPEAVPRHWKELALQSRSACRFWHFEHGKKRQIHFFSPLNKLPIPPRSGSC